MLIDKYKPKNLDDIKGHDVEKEKLRFFVKNYNKQRKKGLFLYGPTGVGKTSSAIALANELNLELFELNASDFRNKDTIEHILGESIKQQSLFGKGKIILIDDVDGISGRKDRGGIPALVKLMNESSFPIILTGIDIFDSKYSSLRKKCELLEFKGVNYLTILKILKNICDKENIKYDESSLRSLARYAGGDVRGAIHDLSVLEEVNDKNIKELSERNKEEKIHNALNLIFKGKDPKMVLNIFNDVNVNLDEAMLWLEENLHLEYKKEDLVEGYDVLSRADVFKGRIRRWQYWRFLVYQNSLMTAGVALAKKEKKKGFVNYKRSSRILKIWISNNKNAKKKLISEKIAKITHCSNKLAFKEVYPYYNYIFKRKFNKELIKELNLDQEEIDYLQK